MKSTLKTFAVATIITALAGPWPVFAGATEFKGKCAYGLIIGADVDTPCEITWKSEDGKTYCFGNQEGKDIFLKDTKTNLAKAKKYYQTLKN